MDTPTLRATLLSLVRSHRWIWSADAHGLVAALPGFDDGRHPVQLLAELDDSQLADLYADQTLADQMSREAVEMADLAGRAPESPDIAYFSPEFGISKLIPQYSGGLGILAGDHLKAASDLGTSLCGVGLFYRQGFFRQSITDGTQVEGYDTFEPADLGCVDTGTVVQVPMTDHELTARVWRLDVGRVPLILLDTDTEPNSDHDRSITDRLYSGDRRHRLEQELVLGIGGSRALAALGWPAPVRHLNEGHAGFLILDLLDREIQSGLGLEDALEAIRAGLVFTTHTPVPAGIDRFTIELATPYLEPWARRWGVPIEDVLQLGRDPGDEPATFNMTALCLKAAGRSNGVSELHGAVSRELFSGVPGGEAIGSVTNGVHARTWVVPRLQAVFDRSLGAGWADGDVGAWQRVDTIDDDTIRTLRRDGAQDLAAVVSDRCGAVIDPDSLVIGFARRFATYKRATLLLQHPEVLAAILADDDRPVHFLFAGKAHPADADGKALLADIVSYGGSAEARGRFTFVPGYDMALARAMYGGCDVWLNTPVRPHEASGTSGEKAALNGGLNCSISDGWWAEMADGDNGWTIPSSDAADPTRRDLDESAAALAILSGEIIPEYHAGGEPWSAAWIARMRHNWTSLGPRVTAARMVTDYQEGLYEPALDVVRRP